MWLNILLIAVILVIITDLSGVVEYIKRHLYFRLRGTYDYPDSWDSPPIHLLSCSFCQVWWTGLLYLIITHTLSIAAVAYLLVICLLTTTIRDSIMFVKELLTRVLDKMFKIIRDV